MKRLAAALAATLALVLPPRMSDATVYRYSVFDDRGAVRCDDRFLWTCDVRGWRW